jgi:hypothetical protein
MPALLFPNLDVLRLVVANDVAPRSVTLGSARAGVDAQGRLWLESEVPLAREALAALARLGVQSIRAGSDAAESVRSWAELLPLKPAAIASGPVLFELPDALLVRFAGLCRRSGSGSFGVQLLAGDDEGRAWLTCQTPPQGLLLRAQEPDSRIEAFAEQAPGVWVRLGWSHPQPLHLAAPDQHLLLLRPPRSVSFRPGPIPNAIFEVYVLAR